MRKKYYAVIGMLTLGMALTGCGSGNGDKTGQTGSSSQTQSADQEAVQDGDQAENSEQAEDEKSFEYEVRDLADPVYRSAAQDFSGGDGSEESPYQIGTAEELQLLSDMLADEDKKYDYKSKNFVLTADIDLNDMTDFDNWSTSRPQYDWRPIGETYAFSGVFDGDGHTIRGMYINTNVEDDLYPDRGLFGELNGTVKNVDMEGAYVEVSGKSSYTGIVAGAAFKAVIENCNVSGNITGYDGEYGGIVGNAGVSTVKDCVFSGKISAVKDKSDFKAGGIAGYSSSYLVTEDDDVDKFEGIVNCDSKGEISNISSDSISFNVGGIAGTNSGKVSGCVSEMDIKVANEGNAQVGGIAGSIVDWNMMSDCRNNGSVSSDKGIVGGIAGDVLSQDARYKVVIDKCVNSANVSCTSGFAGIAGGVTVNTGDVTISGCVNEQDLDGDECAGIIYNLKMMSATISINDNTNKGRIKTSGLYGAGVIGYVSNMGDNWAVNIEGCTNTGDIDAKSNAGGIVCFTYFPSEKNAEGGDAQTSFDIKNCKNSGNITSKSINGFIGGIMAVDGLMGTKVVVSGCDNTGDLSFTDGWAVDAEELSNYVDDDGEISEGFTLSVMAGGIIGRIGQSVFLSTDADTPDASKINAENALVQINDCSSTGKLSYVQPVKGDDVTDEQYNKIMENYRKVSLGGILGDCSCKGSYSVSFSNCTHNAERGVGNTDLPDIK